MQFFCTSRKASIKPRASPEGTQTIEVHGQAVSLQKTLYEYRITHFERGETKRAAIEAARMNHLKQKTRRVAPGY
jgi:hypothetical protein